MFIRALSTVAIASVMAVPVHAGFAFPRTGAGAYCDARAMGMSHSDARVVAIQRSQSPTVVDNSPMDYYNAGMLIKHIKSQCPGRWES